MAFAGINYIAVVIAAVVSFLFGGAWYGLLAKQWMTAARLSEQDVKSNSTAVPMVIAMVGLLVMAFVLAGAIGHLGPGNLSLRNGIISGLFMWAGFVATTLTINYGFQMQPRSLLAIDLGHWLGVLVIQGAVIGLMGV